MRILYVEDEPNLAKVVKESLEFRGFEVNWVADGSGVMAAFDALRPDVVVLDVMLPGKDGFEVAREIRAGQPQVPVLFLTARTQTRDVLEGFQAGGNDYLRKPFSVEELIVRMENLVRMTRSAGTAAPSDEVVLGTSRFSPGRYTLTCGGETRSLSHRETQLLLLFSQHQNRPLARKDILMALWGDDSFFNSRNLDVYVARLRDYLKPDPHLRIITLKGVGYHFLVE
jgi:DNA-binding response OmpR family regulator